MIKKIIILLKLARKIAKSDALKVISKTHEPPFLTKIIASIFSFSFSKRSEHKMNFTDEGGTSVDQVFDMAASCVESISDPNQVYECKDLPRKELIEFFDNLNSKQFGVIQSFFESMPKLSHTVKVTNPNTKVESDVVLEGLASFFV